MNDDSIYSILGEVIRLHFIRLHKVLEEVGLYPGQPRLLFLLHDCPGQTQKQLADKMNIKPSTINVMINRMVKCELLYKKSDKKDQRISRIYISQKGVEIHEKLYHIHDELEEECFANLTEDEKVKLKELLIQVRDNFKNIKDRSIK